MPTCACGSACHVLTVRRRVSYSQERYMFHVLVQDGVTFMVVAEEVGATLHKRPAGHDLVTVSHWRDAFVLSQPAAPRCIPGCSHLGDASPLHSWKMCGSASWRRTGRVWHRCEGDHWPPGQH